MVTKKVNELDEETFRKYLDLFLNDAKRRQIEIPTIAALRSERDALKEALEYIGNYGNYASEGDVYIEDGNSFTHVSNYAESVIKTYSAGNE